jgi:hypothetical protein
MPEFLFALYVVMSALTTVPFALYLREAERDKLRRKSYYDMDSPLLLGVEGWAASLVWPITSVIFGTAWMITRKDRAEAKVKEYQGTLDGARALISADESRRKREQERARHAERLRVAQEKADFDRQLEGADGRTPHPFARKEWKDHVRDIAKRDRLYPFDD